MKHQPLISVVMPAYNAERYIKKAIESILNQTHTNFEFIIINDGSTDDTLAIIKSFKDKRIIVIDHKKNQKIPATLNAGLKMAKGKYIARMDADDESLLTRFTKQIEFLEKHSDIGVLGSAHFSLSPGTKKSKGKYPTSHNDCLKRLTQSPCFSHPTTMIRTSALGNSRYTEAFFTAQDYKLWVDLAKKDVRFANLIEALLYYRVHNNSVSKLKSSQQKSLVKKIQKEYAEYILGENLMEKIRQSINVVIILIGRTHNI